ncbi:MAG: SDR family NAD(P)-dependent oxidoreductase, partial [Woeseiaceae bacterium]
MPGSRTIVVTGATSGIGAATAALLMENGETVIGADVNEPAAGTVDEFVYMDQSDPASIEAAISAMPEGLDGLVNSAGVPPADRYPPVHVVKTNFFGLREFTHKLLGKISEGGAIVNLASAAGMGWAQNIALLKEALAITDIDEVDDFV